jgi:PAS domain S-box-containing protein
MTMKFDPQKDFDAVQSVLDSIPMGVYVLDRERKIQWVNERITNRLQRENVFQSKGKYCYNEIFKREKPCSDCPALKTLKSGRMEYKEIKTLYKGELRHYSVTALPLKGVQEGQEPFIVETIQDVTPQKKAEDELRRVNDFNSAIINNAPVAIFTIDRTGKFMSVNPALATLSDLGAAAEQKLVGFNWLENPYTVQCGLAGHIKKGLDGEPFELQDFPFKTYRGDKGQYLHLRGVPLRGKHGNVEGLLCIIEDNTEKVMAQIQSIQDAKTSVIGRLMTGVAHELNNPLATIAANSELACELFQGFGDGKADEDEMNELREYLEVIQEQAFRCKNIINDMIDLTKKKGFEVKEIDLVNCLNDLLGQINFTKLGIHVIKDIPQGLPHVKGDLNALKQSLMNILQNAVDAVEGREGGMIRLRAHGADGFVHLEVEDNGGGIHEGHVDKIFEPFFSTKGTGKGVGLGLTLCYEFLNRMGGGIDVKSIMGEGSTFRVALPAYSRQKGRLGAG